MILRYFNVQAAWLIVTMDRIDALASCKNINVGAEMNKYQKSVCWCVIVIVMSMMIYPPFHRIREERIANSGFDFIWSTDYFMSTVNVQQLLAQVLIVFISGGIAFFALRDNR